MAVSEIIPAVPSKLFTFDGTAGGLVTVADTTGFQEGQVVTISATSHPTIECTVQRVNSGTQLIVGPVNAPFGTVQNLLAYAVSAAAAIVAAEQPIKRLSLEDISNFTFQPGPISAERTVLVDSTGAYINSSNPLSVNAIVSISSVTIANSITVNLQDGVGNAITSQVSSGQRALDVGIDVAGVQVDPRAIRPLISSDTVTVVQPTGTSLHTTIDNFPATQVVSGTVSSTQGTSPWITSGSVAVVNFPANQVVSGSVDVVNFPATQAVTQSTTPWVTSGSVAIVNFPATQVISGSVSSTQGTSPWVVSGSTSIVNFPATQAVTQSTTPWVVSGTVSSVQGTSPWVVSGSTSVVNFPANQVVSGTVSVAQPITVNQGTNPWVTSGTQSVIQQTNPWIVSGSVAVINVSNTKLNIDVNDGSGNAIGSTISNGTVRGLNVNIAGAQLGLLGRIRVSQLASIFEMYNANSTNSLFFNASAVGTGTTSFNSNNSSVQLQVGTPSGDSIIWQSRSYMRYSPGRAYSLNISGTYGPGKTNVRQRWGYFDSNDGMFFEQLSTGIGVVSRTSTSGSPVDTRIAQANWNLDKLDGTGPSGLTLNTNDHTLYILEYLWHGAGGMRFGVYLGGNIVYCHNIDKASTDTTPFWRSPSKPIRVEMTNTGVSANTTNIQFVCCAFNRDSSVDGATHYSFTGSNGITAKTVPAANLIPLISLRCATTFNGITNRIPISPQETTVMVTNAANIYVQVLLNTTLTGASFASAGTNSSAEIDTTATAISGGTKIAEFYILGNTQNLVYDLIGLLPLSQIGLDVPGTTSEIITIAAQSISGNATTFCTLAWDEQQ